MGKHEDALQFEARLNAEAVATLPGGIEPDSKVGLALQASWHLAKARSHAKRAARLRSQLDALVAAVVESETI